MKVLHSSSRNCNMFSVVMSVFSIERLGVLIGVEMGVVSLRIEWSFDVIVR